MVSKDNSTAIFVPSSILPKLMCVQCKHYLSVFPVYIHPVQGSVCGRCSAENMEDFCRDSNYELAIQFQKFPCIYQVNGCLETLLPSQVQKHEIRCYFKKHECPTKIYSNCTWVGYSRDVINHFEEKHPTFILNDGKFEVDFVNNHSENCIMPYAEDIYVVTRETDSTKDTVSVIVRFIGTDVQFNDYMYKVSLESENKDFVYAVTENLGNKLELKGQVIRKIMNDPVILVAHINIKETSANSAEEKNKNLKSNIDYKQLEELECPVCLEYMVPPIQQCQTGHSFCMSCKIKQTQCPLCRTSFVETQNFTLEKVISNMIYPCKHKNCTYATRPQDIKQHEASCIHGPYSCPLKDHVACSESFSYLQLSHHIEKSHYECFLEFDSISFPFDINDDIWECYILKYSSNLFRVYFNYMKKTKIFYWAVQLIGPPEEVAKYKYELDITDKYGNNRLYTKAQCAAQSKLADSFQNNNFVSFDYNQISRLILNDQLTYRVRILTAI